MKAAQSQRKYTMIAMIEQHRPDIAELCKRFGVQSLEVFGSAADGTFDPTRSDIDFLVEFNVDETGGLFKRNFGLQESLAQLFGCKIDLVEASTLKNPYFIAAVNKSRQTVYAPARPQAARGHPQRGGLCQNGHPPGCAPFGGGQRHPRPHRPWLADCRCLRDSPSASRRLLGGASPFQTLA